jgi:hypothetical protein
MRLVWSAVVGVSLLVPLSRAGDASACAKAPPAGAEPINTAREDALIVWDEPRHTEHFIRSAVFDTSVSSFGFIVPTPSRPALAEADDRIFQSLAEISAKQEHKTRFVPAPTACVLVCPSAVLNRTGSVREAAGVPGDTGVSVVEQTRVAGLDAIVFRVDEQGRLAEWLRAHDFPVTESLSRWTTPYVADKWFFTAFLYSRPSPPSGAGAPSRPIASRAVRMTFSTDTPFYPYREPPDTRPVPGRFLRLFVVGSSKRDAVLGESHAPWTASLPFAARSDLSAEAAAFLPGVDLPARPWIQEFDDWATVRPESDLSFPVAGSSSEVRRPPIYDDVSIPLPIDLILAAGVVGWILRRRRKARAVAT